MIPGQVLTPDEARAAFAALSAKLPPMKRKERQAKSPRGPRPPYRPPAERKPILEHLLDNIRNRPCRHRGERQPLGIVYECDGPDTRIKLCTTDPACRHARNLQVCQRCDHHLPPWPFTPTRSSSPATIAECLDRGHVMPNGWSGWPNAHRTLAERCAAGIGPNQRHLLYFVYPRSHNGVWQKNIDQLLLRIALFNGRRVMAIASDDKADPAGMVRESVAGHGFEFIDVPNTPKLREVIAWLPLWERVAGCTGPNDYTFFAHAKGVTRDRMRTAHAWTTLMYEANLDYWPVVERLLQTHPIAGALKKLGHKFNRSKLSQWIYAGTFYWVRNRDFFARDWRSVEQEWWGTEYYPGVLFSVEEGGVIYGEGGDEMAPSNRENFIRIAKGFNEWKSANTHNRIDIGSLTGACPSG